VKHDAEELPYGDRRQTQGNVKSNRKEAETYESCRIHSDDTVCGKRRVRAGLSLTYKSIVGEVSDKTEGCGR
jgi:hypothetical protein